MREPGRIERILNLVRKIWYIYPDQRFGQLITNCISSEMWFIEDDEIEKRLKEILERGMKNNV
jgi:hypothetical protein